jgi:LPXTG-motif cell wall-anchored protein
MLRRKIGSTLAGCGMLVIMFSMSALPAHGAASTAVRLAPSPRPAVSPLNHHSGASVEMGHITGTVIDVRTGAPAAGVSVSVGGDLVATDANGNYDHWLPVGSYPVLLQLAADQGTVEQGEILVAVQPANATVQHLGFRSLAPAEPAPAEPAPAAPAPTAIIPKPAPAAKPAKDAGVSAPVMAVDSAVPPQRLPRTGAEEYTAWLWLGFGMLLLLGGGLVGFGPVLNGRSAAALIRTHAANHQLLQALLSQPARDEFLTALFDLHDRRR